jgi:hypothetical protein
MNDRRGIALVLALFALVVMGALVATTFVIGRLEMQSGRNTFFAFQAAEAAEAGLSDAAVGLSEAFLQPVPVGGTLDLPEIDLSEGVLASRVVVRLTGRLFLVRSTGHRLDAAGNDLAVRTLGSLVKLVPDSSSAASVVRPIRERSWVQMY